MSTVGAFQHIFQFLLFVPIEGHILFQGDVIFRKNVVNSRYIVLYLSSRYHRVWVHIICFPLK